MRPPKSSRPCHRVATILLLAATTALGAPPARADQTTVKLIQLLIDKGIISKTQAADLLRQSGVPAAALTHAHKTSPPITPPPELALPAESPTKIHVTYVPEFIRQQIADQVRAEVMTQAEEEGYGSPSLVPNWPSRLKVYGDLRFRAETALFDHNNYNQFVNFNGINNGSPLDLNAQPFPLPPYLNTTTDRNFYQIRARFGIQATINDWMSSDIRLATGNSSSPVSTNQTLGTPGEFSLYQAWIDRAYFTFRPTDTVAGYLGRMPNPFFTTDLLFYDDLGFDGVALHDDQPITKSLDVFFNGGAFPVFNTAFDFSTNNFEKTNSHDAYLFAAQGGLDWHMKEYAAKLGIGFFDFNDVQGAVSDPCPYQISGTGYVYSCSTDSTRPPFLQFGNTLFPIRNLVSPPLSTTNPIPPDPQYFGLASRFAVLDIHPRLDILNYHPVDIEIDGDFAKNLAYNRSEILSHGPTNQPGPVNNNLATVNGQNIYQGGDTAYMMKVSVGHLDVEKLWDWNVFLGYKYLESDSVLDAINDPNFHLGGTNAKGFILGGSLGIGRNTNILGRWFSSTQVSGPPYQNDVLEIDLQSSF